MLCLGLSNYSRTGNVYQGGLDGVKVVRHIRGVWCDVGAVGNLSRFLERLQLSMTLTCDLCGNYECRIMGNKLFYRHSSHKSLLLALRGCTSPKCL